MRRGNKPVRAICGRSGTECFLHEMVEDGFIRGLYVLPEYYCPPQPVKFKLPTEVPPYNPQPLADVWAGVIDFTNFYNLSYQSDAVNPPFVYIDTGRYKYDVKFKFAANGRNVRVNARVGDFIIEPPSIIFLEGIQVVTTVGTIGMYLEKFPYGTGGWGDGPYQAKAPGNGWGRQTYGQMAWPAGAPDVYGSMGWGSGPYHALNYGIAWGNESYSYNPWAGVMSNVTFGLGTWGYGPWEAAPLAYSYGWGKYSQGFWPAQNNAPFYWGQNTYGQYNWSGV